MVDLTPSQMEVLTAAGHQLVVGGPGSGKTTVGILKAAKIAREKLRPGQRILFLSFARATVSRVFEAIGKDYGEALGDTTNTERLAWLKASTERPEHQQIFKRRRALCERGMRAAGPQATSASRGAKRQDAERRWRTACRFCHDRTV